MEMKKTYDFKAIEKRWQKRWEEKKAFHAKEDKKKKKFYSLDMFPYPSGAGLHMGHAFVFSLGDIFARRKRMQGLNVLYPVGYDSFGLPAENAAIKAGIHPEEYTKKSIANFMRQQKAMGWSYDWQRMIKTSDPGYYRWDQWIFLKMLEKGLAYRKRSPVNWCPKCQTVLANEQVVNGKCWRHEDTDVEIRSREQWFLKITKYAEELLSGLDKIDWPERAKAIQKNWIGKSEGTEILFEVNGKRWPVFTTRPDTIFGVTFLVVSAQHPRLTELVTEKQKAAVEKFLKKIKSTSEKELKETEKEGVFTGSYAVNPINKEKIPIYAGNFVVADYGSGMVMAVPAHDQRDFEFAKKYKLPIKPVITGGNIKEKAYEDYGTLMNSGAFNGLQSDEAIVHVTKDLEFRKLGKRTVQYKLRDWLISRQRYWGAPIPIVYCDNCGIVPVPEKDLPVELPLDVKFGRGNPLATNKKFMETTCPKCKGKARRETDTMDTFVNSSWYYLRYTDPGNNKEIFDKKKANYWAPIDQYIGGPEHITGHLMYIRFYTKFLRDLGLLDFSEPALRYFTQGIVHGSDGERMSKSRGNVVEPLETIKKYGADTLRLALMSFASPNKDTNWDEKIVFGSHKLLKNIYGYFCSFKPGKKDERLESRINSLVSDVTRDIQDFQYNLAVIRIRKFFQSVQENNPDKRTAETFLKLLSPFCPHITEELWSRLGNKSLLSLEKWPVADPKKINPKFEEEEKAIDSLVTDVLNVSNIIKTKGKEPKKLYIYVLPNELETYSYGLKEIEKRTELKTKIFSVADKDKLDPEGKSKKVKPGRPGIYME